ncbi:MAG: hypothetical protein V1736_03545 [Pseudomonadota bacterium]
MRTDIRRLAHVILLAGLGLVFSFGIALGQQEAASPQEGTAGEAPWCPPPAPKAAPGVQWCPSPVPEAQQSAPEVGWCPSPASEAAPGVPWCLPPAREAAPQAGVYPPGMSAPRTTEGSAALEGAKPGEEMAPVPDFEKGLLPQTGMPMGPETFGQHWAPYPDNIAVQFVGPTDFQGPAYGAYGAYYGRQYEEFPAGVPAFLFQDQRLAQAMRADEPQAGAAEESPYEEMPVTLNMDDARAVMGNYLAGKNDPALRLGNVTDMGDHYEALILNPQGCAVERVMVDKSRSIQSLMSPQAGVPEPQMKSAEAAVCVTADDARRIFEGFLATKDPNLTIGTVQDMGTYFQAPVLSPQGCAVQKLTVPKSMGVRTEKPTPQTGAPMGRQQFGGAQAEARTPATPLSETDARAVLHSYANAQGKNMRLGTVEDTNGHFTATILDRNGCVAQTVRLDKNTCTITPVR